MSILHLFYTSRGDLLQYEREHHICHTLLHLSIKLVRQLLKIEKTQCQYFDLVLVCKISGSPKSPLIMAAISAYPPRHRDISPPSSKRRRLSYSDYADLPLSPERLETISMLERRVRQENDLDRIRTRLTRAFDDTVKSEFEFAVRARADRLLASRPELLHRSHHGVYDELMKDPGYARMLDDVDRKIKGLVETELLPVEASLEASLKAEAAQNGRGQDEHERSVSRIARGPARRVSSMGHSDEPIRSPRAGSPVERPESSPSPERPQERRAHKEELTSRRKSPGNRSPATNRSYKLPEVTDEEALNSLIAESRLEERGESHVHDHSSVTSRAEDSREIPKAPPRGPRNRPDPRDAHASLNSPKYPDTYQDRSRRDLHHPRDRPDYDRPSHSRANYEVANGRSDHRYENDDYHSNRIRARSPRSHSDLRPNGPAREYEQRSHGDRFEYRSSRYDQDRHHDGKPRSAGYDERDDRNRRHEEPRTRREAPSHIDRYVPGGDNADRRRR